MQRKKICIVSTVPFVLKWFMENHIKLLSKEYDITLITNGHAEDLTGLLRESVSFIPAPIKRKISIFHDIAALITFIRLFRKHDFDSVHSIMPKSGLLAMLASNITGVPIRVHTFTGQPWANKHGLKRWLLKTFDRILASNASQLFADSHSQRQFLIDNAITHKSSISVLCQGSIAGVNIEKFKHNTVARNQIRKDNSIPIDATVFLFLGRITKDKGLIDLTRAFNIVAKKDSSLYLLIVGPSEENLDKEFSELSNRFPGKVIRIGNTDKPESYMSASDILCLPSYREGFGTVIIEAASVGLPAIASRIYGITDAIIDDVTGILHTPKSEVEIANAMLLLANNKEQRSKMGQAAKVRAIQSFSQESVSEALVNFYRKALYDAKL